MYFVSTTILFYHQNFTMNTPKAIAQKIVSEYYWTISPPLNFAQAKQAALIQAKLANLDQSIINEIEKLW
jgi:hypothetical protein